jgi:chemotaxis protein histidine kinase CheA
MDMGTSPEPALDLSEIVGLYKEDARRMTGEMRAALDHWDDVAAGGKARSTLRRLSHQLRGSGRTYGFNRVTRISKTIEHIMISLEKLRLPADDRVRQSLAGKVDQLMAIFRE